MEELAVYGSIAVTGGVISLTLRLAEPIFRPSGPTGIQVLERGLGRVLPGIAC